MISRLAALLALPSLVASHFVLINPVSLGYDDTRELLGPCGGFTPTDRSTGVTDWPLSGSWINVLTTHEDVIWTYSMALLSDPTTWIPVTPKLHQLGVGQFCEPSMPPNPAWVGQDAILQVIQDAVDGLLYQCAAIRIVADGLSPPDGSCFNTSIEAQWQAPPPLSSTTTTSTSTTPPPTTSPTTTTPTTSPPPTTTPTTTPPPPTTSTSSPTTLTSATRPPKCNANNCARAVTGTRPGKLPVLTSRQVDCRAFQTKTVRTRADGCAAATVAPRPVPAYASACHDAAAYASACSCWGIPTGVVKVPV